MIHVNSFSAKAGSGKHGKTTKEEFLHGDVDAKRMFLTKILTDETKVGFLMLFCENEYCTENIRFVVATAEYRNHFHNDSKNKWKNWEVLDKDHSQWSVHEISDDVRTQIERTLAKITSEYMSTHSKYEICTSSDIIARTEERLKNYSVYGPEVFKEACLDPLNTLIKDILPRFVVSESFVDMNFFIQKLEVLPTTDSMTFSGPSSNDSVIKAVQSQLLTEEDIQDYCKDDVVMYFRDPLLYSYFLKYLQRIHAEENLLCVAQINKYNKAYDAYIRHGGLTSERTVMNRTKAVDLYSTAELYNAHIVEEEEYVTSSVNELRAAICHQAWTIYLYFLAPQSAYEVSVSYHVHQLVARTLACPARDMFQDVKIEAMKVVNREFESFLSTTDHSLLLEAVRRRRHGPSTSEKTSNSEAKSSSIWASCLGLSAKAESKSSRSISPATCAK